MGNNNSYRITTNPPLDPKTYFQTDLPKFIVQKRIGNGKFLKSYLMHVDSVPVVVKVYMRNFEEDLQAFASKLSFIWKELSPTKHPNILPYQCWIKSSLRLKSNASPVYLIRQYINTNLHDRISTRPFLHEYEKLWIIFQLFKCLEICHSSGVYHGDVKPENVLMTTWNWVVLTDFSPFKPTTIPDDDPTDFQYFFDGMGRNCCYVAPERFITTRRSSKAVTATLPKFLSYATADDIVGTNPESIIPGRDIDFSSAYSTSSYAPVKPNMSVGATNLMPYYKTTLKPAMDVFSLGCTMAEVFLDGEPLLDLPGILKYISASTSKKGAGGFERLDQDDSPAKSALLRISNKQIRQVIIDMTQRDPDKRLSVNQYRQILEGGLRSGDQSVDISGMSNLEASAIASAGHGPDVNSEQQLGPVFPAHFDSTLYPLFLEIHFSGNTPDDRINIICQKYGNLVLKITGEVDERGSSFFSKSLSNTDASIISTPNANSNNGGDSINKPNEQSNANVNTSASDESYKETRRQSLLSARRRNPNEQPKVLLSDPLINDVKSESKSSSLSLEDLMKRCKSLIEDIEGIVPKAPAEAHAQGSASSHSNMSESAQDILDEADKYCRTEEVEEGEEDLNDAFFSLSTSVNNRKISNGLVILVQLIISNFLHLKHPQSKIVSLMLLVRMGLKCSDDIILQHIVPILVKALDDSVAYVRATAIRAIRALVMVIRKFSSFESEIFPQYIFPAISRLAKDAEIIVRIAFAESIVRIAEAAKRFLDTSHMMALNKAISEANPSNAYCTPNSRDEDNIETTTFTAAPVIVEFEYDTKLKLLHEQVSRWIRELALDNSSTDSRRGSGLSSYGSIVKRTLLVDLMRLCTFFGQESTMDMLLTQLLTFLSDQDWELRYAFCAKIPYVCVFMGKAVTSECILPCIENAFVDVEEKVISRALLSLTQLSKLSLISKVATVELVPNVTPMLLHPSVTVREQAIRLIGTAAESLEPIDRIVLLAPSIRPYLKYSIHGMPIDSRLLTLALLPPVSRRTFRKALFDRQIHSSIVKSNDTAPAGGANIHAGINSAASSFSAISIDPTISSSSEDYLNKDEGEDVILVSSASTDRFDNNNIPLSYPVNVRNKLAKLSKELYSDSTDEIDRVLLMDNYIDRAAREMITKTIQWKNGIAAGASVKGYVTVLGRALSQRDVLNSTNLDSLLDISAASMPDHSVQSILIPNQKYGVGFFVFQPAEEMRCNMIDNLTTIKSFVRLRNLYGITPNRYEAARNLIQQASSMDYEPLGNNPSNGSGTPMSAASGSAGAGNTSSTGQTGGGGEYDNNTTTMSAAKFVQEAVETSKIIKRIKALNIPPLPPDLGSLHQPDGRKFNYYAENLDLSTSADTNSGSRSQWRPKENVLVSSLLEHTNSVNRLALSSDQSFFISASSDKTAKVWQVRGLDKAAFPRSALTYNNHKGAVLDVAILENTHSVATASDDNSVHVWRVDMTNTSYGGLNGTNGSRDISTGGGAGADAYGSQNNTLNSGNNTSSSNTDGINNNNNSVNDGTAGGSGARNPGLSVVGHTIIKTLNPSEGSVVSLQHFNSDVCSVLMYATQKGTVHGWDLRSVRDAMTYTVRPELGYPTCMTLAPDRNWVCVGTDKGYIGLWDIRFNIMNSLWRHSSASSIHRLACCKSMSHGSSSSSGINSTNGSSFLNASTKGVDHMVPPTEGAYLIVAAGNNEAAVWGLPEGGDCLKCFRSIPLSASRNPLAPLPSLREVNIPGHPLAPIVSTYESQRQHHQLNMHGGSQQQQKSIRAVIGRISQSGSAFLITAGTDRQIRFWDFFTPQKCFTVSGLEQAQPKPTYDIPVDATQSKMFLCYDTEVPSSSAILTAHIPTRDSRGPMPPTNSFKDAITDLKNLDLPMRLMISSSKDGSIKLWR